MSTAFPCPCPCPCPCASACPSTCPVVPTQHDKHDLDQLHSLWKRAKKDAKKKQVELEELKRQRALHDWYLQKQNAEAAQQSQNETEQLRQQLSTALTREQELKRQRKETRSCMRKMIEELRKAKEGIKDQNLEAQSKQQAELDTKMKSIAEQQQHLAEKAATLQSHEGMLMQRQDYVASLQRQVEQDAAEIETLRVANNGLVEQLTRVQLQKKEVVEEIQSRLSHSEEQRVIIQTQLVKLQERDAATSHPNIPGEESGKRQSFRIQTCLECEHSRAQMSDLEWELADLKLKYKTLSTRREQQYVEGLGSNTCNACEHSRARISDLESQLSDIQRKSARREQQYVEGMDSNTCHACQHSRAQIEHSRARISDLESQLSDLQLQLKSARREQQYVEGMDSNTCYACQRSRAQIEHSRARISDLEFQLSNLQLKSARREQPYVEGQGGNTCHSCEHSRARISDLEFQLSDVQLKSPRHDSKYEDVMAEVRRLQSKVEDLNETNMQLNAVLDSTVPRGFSTTQGGHQQYLQHGQAAHYPKKVSEHVSTTGSPREPDFVFCGPVADDLWAESFGQKPLDDWHALAGVTSTRPRAGSTRKSTDRVHGRAEETWNTSPRKERNEPLRGDYAIIRKRESDYWIPCDVFKIMNQFLQDRLPNFRPSMFYEVLVSINRVWKNKENRRVELLVTQHEKELSQLKARNNAASVDETAILHDLEMLKRNIADARMASRTIKGHQDVAGSKALQRAVDYLETAMSKLAFYQTENSKLQGRIDFMINSAGMKGSPWVSAEHSSSQPTSPQKVTSNPVRELSRVVPRLFGLCSDFEKCIGTAWDYQSSPYKRQDNVAYVDLFHDFLHAIREELQYLRNKLLTHPETPRE